MSDFIQEDSSPRYSVVWDNNGVKTESEGTKELLQAAGVPQEAIEEAAAKEASTQTRDAVRRSIYSEVADSDSMFGTVADASQMLVLASLADLVALESASTFEEYRQARLGLLAGMSGGDASSLIASAKDFLAKVETGEIKMPFLAKDGQATGVFEDVAVRATGVANVLIAASKA